ncbi:hypothetical protein AY601_0018 [Pedobacter cryoconitis]|uniref:Uncharacterized protein n=1 Tax=Pedobacter cryoconitis TaxID=188932 RepID=A0A127V6R1_9SPHI|nr:hypothetical protein AY601_0018 [Pedobacter cryoconitis]
MAKAWYIYDGSGSPFSSNSYTLYNFSDLNAVPPCPNGCKLFAIKSTTSSGGFPIRPIAPLSSNIQAYLTTFFIAQETQPNVTDPYILGKKPC